jgi:hypothetical protein
MGHEGSSITDHSNRDFPAPTRHLERWIDSF